MKSETTLEESLRSSQRDVGLILEDIKRKEFDSAISGFETVIRDLETMRSDLRIAWERHERTATLMGLDPNATWKGGDL